MPDLEAVRIREYRRGDERGINRLFNEIFGATRSLEEWQWKFERNPVKPLMIAVAESGGEVVGQYACVTSRFQYLGAAVPVAMPVDNFIHPRFRGGIHGVQKALFEYQGRLWHHRFGFGFPTREHYVLGKRMLKYRDVARMPVLFRRLGVRGLVEQRFPRLPSRARVLLGKAGGLAVKASIAARRTATGVAIRRVDSFDARFDALWESVQQKHKVICVRDLRFLGWRYGRPGAGYRIAIAEKNGELAGYVVTRVRREGKLVVGYLVDLLTDESQGVDAALVKHALLELLSSGADYALCWMLPDKPAFRALRRLGFRRREHAFASPHVVYRIFDASIDEAILTDPRSWYLTMGDSDAY